MKRLLVTLTLFFLVAYAKGQFIHKIKGDSILITNDSCSAELNLENSTKNVNGFLYNNGNGRTSFKRGMIKLNDSTYLFGADTLRMKNILSTLGYNGINIYNSDGSLFNNRFINLDTSSFSIGKSSTKYFQINNNGSAWFGRGSANNSNYMLTIDSTLKVNHRNWNVQAPKSVLRIGDDDFAVFDITTKKDTTIYTFRGNNKAYFSNWGFQIQQAYSTDFIAGPYNDHIAFSFGNSEKIRLVGPSGNLLIGTIADDSTAILKLVSSTKGFLPPKWTKTQRLAIDGISPGLIGYQTDSTENLYIFKNIGWKRVLTEDDQDNSVINIYNSNGSVTNNRFINLDTSNFSIGKSSDKYFQIYNNGSAWFGKGVANNSSSTLTVDSSFMVRHKYWHNSKQVLRIGDDDFALFDISTNVQEAIFSFQGNSKTFINNWGLQIVQGETTNFKSGNYNKYVNFSFGSYDRLRIMNNGDILIGTTTDDTTAILNLVSTKKGFLPPRWSYTQRLAINAPSTGLIGYQQDNTENLYLFKSTGWKRILTEDDQTTNIITDPGSNGIISRTALNTSVSRTITGNNGIGITNGNGVSGDPTVFLDITNMTNETQPDIESDAIPFYDASASTNKKTNLWRLGVSKYIILSGNVSTSSTTLNTITGFIFNATANAIYEVEIFGAYQSAAATTGIAVALDIPTNASVIGINVTSISSTTVGGAYQNADNSTVSPTGASSGVQTANTNTPIHAKFVVNAGSTGGSVQAIFKSEVSGSSVTLQGSLTYMKITRIN